MCNLRQQTVRCATREGGKSDRTQERNGSTKSTTMSCKAKHQSDDFLLMTTDVK